MSNRIVLPLAAALSAAMLSITPAAAQKARPGIAGAVAAHGLGANGHPAAADGLRPMTPQERQSAGCLLTGTALLGASYAVGPTELIAILAGGAVPGATTPLIGLAVVSTVFASGCAIGAIGSPALLWTYEQSDALYAAAVAGLTGTPFPVGAEPDAGYASPGADPTLPETLPTPQ